MVVRRGEGDFARVYRPCRISEVVGNERVKKIIGKAFADRKVPNTYLFHGLSGTGKTTIARIIELGLNCENGPTAEPCCECKGCKSILNRDGLAPIREINAVDVVKEDLRKHLIEMKWSSFGFLSISDTNLLLVDECHGLTDEQAGLFLTHVEDVDSDCYFIFCTTDPDKFLHTLRNRCVINVKFDRVPGKEIFRLLTEICEQESVEPDEKMLWKIVKKSNGMPRNAVNALQATVLAGELKKKEIRFLEGKNNIIVVAPHESTVDDENTNLIAEQLRNQLGCYAVINEKYKRAEINLNDISDVKKKGIEKEFLVPLRKFKDEIKGKGLSPLIIYVHGIKNKKIQAAAGNKVKILIGYGQGKEKSAKRPHRYTLLDPDLKLLQEALAAEELYSDRAPHDSGYCAWEETNLNQLFNLETHKNYYDPAVRSVQLEIKAGGLRKTEIQARETGELLAEALKQFVDTKAMPLQLAVIKSEPEKAPDEKLVIETYEYLKGVVQRHFHRAMLEAGTYIIEKFFDGDFEHAQNPRNATKIHSLNELIRRLQGNDGHGPSKTWVYNAVKLAVDENQFKRFSVYGKLGLSHKVYLTHVKNLETKRRLIQEAVENNYTVAQTRCRIAEVQRNGHQEKVSLSDLPADEDLEKVGRDELLRLKQEALSRIEFYKEKLAFYEERLGSITTALKSIASKRNALPDHSKVIELPAKEAAVSKHQHQQREQGMI